MDEGGFVEYGIFGFCFGQLGMTSVQSTCFLFTWFKSFKAFQTVLFSVFV